MTRKLLIFAAILATLSSPISQGADLYYDLGILLGPEQESVALQWTAAMVPPIGNASDRTAGGSGGLTAKQWGILALVVGRIGQMIMSAQKKAAEKSELKPSGSGPPPVPGSGPPPPPIPSTAAPTPPPSPLPTQYL